MRNAKQSNTPAESMSRTDRTTEPSILPLEVSKLEFVRDGKHLIDNLDLKLSTNGLTMILGANGSGKSLLLRLIHGLLSPSGGSIHWAGQPLNVTNRLRQAMVFQRPVLLRRSTAANIDFVLKLKKRMDISTRDSILAEVDLLDKAKQPARLLSGGEQQRLILARALALQPEVLLLDEPTASLDPASTLAIENIVKRAHDGGTKIVFVSHDIHQARRLADEIVLMHAGKVVDHSPVEEFFQAPVSAHAQAYLRGDLLT